MLEPYPKALYLKYGDPTHYRLPENTFVVVCAYNEEPIHQIYENTAQILSNAIVVRFPDDSSPYVS